MCIVIFIATFIVSSLHYNNSNIAYFFHRLKLRLLGHVIRTVPGHAGHARLESAHEAHANLFQAPPAPNDEVVLCDQSQSGCEGSQAAIAKDWITQAGTTG